jgi:hypothetical protein
MTPEGKIEAYLKKRVREDGARTRKLKWIGMRGAPDRLVWWPGDPDGSGVAVNMVFVEVKAPGKKATKQQEREHKKLRDDGFEVCVVSTRDEVDQLILDYTNYPWGHAKV